MVSFTYAACLIVIDSLCITCYLLIKKVRKLTDERNHEYPSIGDAVASGSTAISSAIATLSGSSSNEENGDTETGGGFAAKAKLVGKAAVLENTSMSPNTVERFPDWQPLPFRCGIITMLVLLGLTTVLLTPEIILDRVSSTSSSLQLCRGVDGGIDHHIDMVRETLTNITRINYARFEDSYTKEFLAALSEDTSRYGTDDYPCRGIASQERQQWEDMNANKTFFTGWCEEQRAKEIDASKKQTVTIPRECKTARVRACLDSWGLSLFCKSASKEVCVGPVTYPSPDVNAVDNELKLVNYQMELERMEELRERTLNMPGADSISMIRDDISQASTEFAEQLKFQVDVASYLYIIYICIAAFFPSPIVLFRTPLSVKVKRNVFGMRKETFVLGVLVVWFGVTYFKKFAVDPSIQLYLANLSANPCYADPAFLKQKQQAISDVCYELEKLKTERTIRQQEIEQKLFMADFMLDTCNCPIPNLNLTEYMHMPQGGLFVSSSREKLPDWVEAINMKARNAPYYENIYIGLIPWTKLTYAFYLPQKDSPFIGNTTVCEDTEFQREQIHSAPESDMNWFELWISSGMLAQLFTKFVAANFCAALLKSADPLGSIDGM